MLRAFNLIAPFPWSPARPTSAPAPQVPIPPQKQPSGRTVLRTNPLAILAVPNAHRSYRSRPIRLFVTTVLSGNAVSPTGGERSACPMKIGWRIAWFIACLLGWCSEALAAPMLDAPALEYSQDGVNYQSFDAIVGRTKIGTYYDYHDKSGHPAFGTQRGTASVAVYFDDKHNALSLILMSGTAGCGKGRATIQV